MHCPIFTQFLFLSIVSEVLASPQSWALPMSVATFSANKSFGTPKMKNPETSTDSEDNGNVNTANLNSNSGYEMEKELDPLVDDIDALNEESSSTEEDMEDDAEKRKQQLLQCSARMSPLVPSMRLNAPHFHSWNLSCYRKNAKRDQSDRLSPNPAKSKENDFWSTVWMEGKRCLKGEFSNLIASASNCHLLIGFVDHLHNFHNQSLVVRLQGEKMHGNNAVVRLLCGAKMEQFREDMRENRKVVSRKKKKSDEETFLKTVFVLEYTWRPDCLDVFFDSRTLDPNGDNKMAQLLWSGGEPKFGTANGGNKWAASKFICGDANRSVFHDELSLMRERNAGAGKELRDEDTKIREVLTVKVDEEMFSTYEVTTLPESGFFQRILSEVFG